MSTLVLRSVKGSPLTSAEIDANVTNLNTDKADKASPTFTGTVTLPNSLLQVTASSYPTIQPSLNLDFANTRQLDPRITFVRNSTAAYYDGQTTAMAEQNLLKYSQYFSNAVWQVASSGGGVTGIKTNNYAVAPDGTTTAARVQLDVSAGSVGAQSQVYQNYACPTGVVLCSSSWIKTNDASTKTIMGFSPTSSTPATITVTGTWQQLSALRTSVGATNNFQIILVNGTTSSTADLLVWGAQAEQRSSATAYTPTITAAITNYIPVLLSAPAGVARFDCDPITGKSLGLLIEEIRVNLLDFSSSFATSGGVQNNWADTNITRTAAAFIAPDSTQVGIQFTASAANATVISTAAVGSSLARTFSVWLKRISGTGVINYTLDNGTTWIAQAITSTVTRYIFTTTTANQQVGFQIVTAGDSIGIWGAQLEAGSFATSYIPTVASTVTRAADTASMTGTNFSSWYNQSQGSLYVEIDTINNYVGSTVFRISDGSGNNRIELGSYTGNASRYLMVTSGANPFISVFGTPVAQVKLAVTFIVGNYLQAFNGTYTTASTSILPLPLVNKLDIGNELTSNSWLSGHIKKISYYPVALSSSNLVALTS